MRLTWSKAWLVNVLEKTKERERKRKKPFPLGLRMTFRHFEAAVTATHPRKLTTAFSASFIAAAPFQYQRFPERKAGKATSIKFRIIYLTWASHLRLNPKRDLLSQYSQLIKWRTVSRTCNSMPGSSYMHVTRRNMNQDPVLVAFFPGWGVGGVQDTVMPGAHTAIHKGENLSLISSPKEP